MPRIKVLLDIDSKVWDAVPTVARWLNLTADVQNAAVASQMFEALVMEAYFEARAGHVTISVTSEFQAEQALSELLDPDVSTPVVLSKAIAHPGIGKSLIDLFDEYAKDANDPWIKLVLAKTENLVQWKKSLAAVYQVIQGSDRLPVGTWQLIEKTYHLLKKSVDNSPPEGDNGSVPSGTSQPLKP